MEGLFRFIKERFASMPQWVQVSTYVSFVVVFIYLLTAPRFLDMRLVSNDYGDEFPIGGAQVEVEISGRVLTLLTDTKGRFSVPVSTNYPMGSYLFILSPDSNSGKIKEIKVPVSNSYLERSKIIYSKKTNAYQIIPNGMLENAQQLFAAIHFMNSAYADDKQTPTSITKEEIESEIFKALEVVTKIPTEKIPLSATLRDLELDNIDLSYISDRLNKKYNIDSLPDFLRSALTVEDLITIASNQYYKNNPLQAVSIAIKKVHAMSESLPDIPTQAMKDYKLGKTLRKSKKHDLAIQVLEKVVTQQPKFYFAWLNLALAYEDVGNNAQAEAAFLSAIAIEQEKKLNDAAVYNAYGVFLFKLNRYKEATRQFNKEKQLRAINPDSD
jgi:tetratricopeptide (TPR) repeat protein